MGLDYRALYGVGGMKSRADANLGSYPPPAAAGRVRAKIRASCGNMHALKPAMHTPRAV